MDFTLDKPIYRQIIDRMGEHILRREWREGERIPAVREFAMQLRVNPNTVMRAYENLQAMGAIEMRRGVGYFVAEGAYQRTMKDHREMFLLVDMTKIFDRLEMLGIEPSDIYTLYEQYKNENGK